MSYKVQKPCKVCGKMYTPCSDCEKDNKIFKWRTVACSIECAMKYFEQVEMARNPVVQISDCADNDLSLSEEHEKTVVKNTDEITTVSSNIKKRRKNKIEGERIDIENG